MIHIAYLFLSIAIIVEIIGTTFLKASAGFDKMVYFIIGISCFVFALFFMTLSFKTVPLSIGYAVWSGVGTAGAAIIGLLIWHEKLSFINYFGMTIIVLGVVLLSIPAVD